MHALRSEDQIANYLTKPLNVHPFILLRKWFLVSNDNSTYHLLQSLARGTVGFPDINPNGLSPQTPSHKLVGMDSNTSHPPLADHRSPNSSL